METDWRVFLSGASYSTNEWRVVCDGKSI